MEVVFKVGRVQFKKVACLISIQTGFSIAKQCTHNIPLSNAAEADLQVLFEVQEFKGVNDIPKEPFNSNPDLNHSSIVPVACEEMGFGGEF